MVEEGRVVGGLYRVGAVAARAVPVHRSDDAAFLGTYGLQGDGAVLVRPDGHVAWRRSSGAEVDADELVRALVSGS